MKSFIKINHWNQSLKSIIEINHQNEMKLSKWEVVKIKSIIDINQWNEINHWNYQIKIIKCNKSIIKINHQNYINYWNEIIYYYTSLLIKKNYHIYSENTNGVFTIIASSQAKHSKYNIIKN